MDFFSNISPSIVLALGAKWFTGFGTRLEVSAAVNCHTVLKSKTAVLFTFFHFLFNFAFKVAEYFFLTLYISVILAAPSYCFSQTDVRRPTYSKFEITYLLLIQIIQ